MTESPSYTPATALLVVDVQNDFAAPSGSLAVEGGETIIPAINGQLRRAHEAGALVVYTQDWDPGQTPHFQKDGGVWPVHCVGDSHGAALHPALEVLPGAPVIRKGTAGEDGYSAFTVRDPVSGDPSATELGSLLRKRDITHVVIAGLATDYCVKETALDARRLGFGVTVLRDAVRAVNLQAGDGDRALAEVMAAGASVAG